MPKDQYMCQLCANHGIFNQPKKGHKQKCPHKACECNLCALNTKRRALDQIERQLKNNGSSSESELHQEEPSISSATIINQNMDASSKAGQPSPVPSLASFKVPAQPNAVTKSTHNHSYMRPSTSKVQHINNNNNDTVMSIALPATLTKMPVFIKSFPGQNLKAGRILPIGDLNEKRRKTDGSIFHSAEKLAQSG